MSGITGAAVKVGRTGRGLLPSGRLLTPEVWARRHRGIVWLLWLHVAGIAVLAMARGNGLAHSLEEASLVAVFALAAAHPLTGVPNRRVWEGERADQALYVAKAEGRSRHVLAS